MDSELPNDAFWVEGGRLMAGPYPGSPSHDEVRPKVARLLDAGVTVFIDLTEEAELEPYEHALKELGGEREIEVGHFRHSIRDLSIPTQEEMSTVLNRIRITVDAGEVVYVHCLGGVGRTGTVLGCYLVERGLSPEEAASEIARLRRDTQRAHRLSPETREQHEFIFRWVRGS